ncbi:MAG: hypothetical protein O3C60_19745 [Planctomycetota bacterium]|nr:hypothetical protein [Planctomycetota bacterium]
MTVPITVAQLERIPPRAAAWLLGYRSTSSLQTSPTLPRNEDGSFNAAKLVAWREEEVHRRTKLTLPVENSALEYKRRLEAKKLEIQLLEMEKSIISVEVTDQFFSLLTGRLRDLGELLQRQYGRDALALLNEALDDIEATIQRWRASLDGDEDS